MSPDSTPLPTTLCFSIQDQVGGLETVLAALKSMAISLTRIESRPSKTVTHEYDFFVDFDAKDSAQVDSVVDQLKQHTKKVCVIGAEANTKGNTPNFAPHPLQLFCGFLDSVAWFPRKLADLDSFADKTYRTGQPLPTISYTDEENETWGAVYRRLTAMYQTHACREHQYVFPLLEQNCGYSDKGIPQLDAISRFLKDCTGFTLRPVMGLLSSRDFLNAFAFRVFYSTQYIRHASKPFYTPEPDCCHELLGHVPLFADPDFADFCQEIGLASLGASDQDIERLATIFWFTVEFGLCRQGDEIKAYGAGLLSSFGELEYSLSDAPELRPFDPAKTAVQKYPITEFQPVYFVADSFKDAQEKVRSFAAHSMHRPFSVRYNALTQTIEVLDNKEKVSRFAKSIRDDMKTLTTVLESLA
ncbi:hypothetical protein [Absidia glauca]|uniref:phenylalanine 4-monooxygenase n=1 Tax=Absidia glauca TaxID=4829 RepID=A0A168NLH9_ABSGL|nr:hypothetical protein [Absidia glauca]